MLVDWFIVAAQIFNFLLLVVLLRWVLYDPIRRVIRQRRDRIRHDIQKAEEFQQTAQREMERQQSLLRDLEAHHQQLLAEANAKVEAQRLDQLARLRTEVEERRQLSYQSLQEEKEACLQTVKQRVLLESQFIARKALKDLANVDLEHQIVAVFIDRLKHLDPLERDAIQTMDGVAHGPIKVQTSFPLPKELRQLLIDQVLESLACSGRVTFLDDPRFPIGIQLGIEGKAIRWTLDHYLGDLDRHLTQALLPKGSSVHDSATASA